MKNFQVDEVNPGKMCVKCLTAINEAAEFKEMALRSDSCLRGLQQQQQPRPAGPETGREVKIELIEGPRPRSVSQEPVDSEENWPNDFQEEITFEEETINGGDVDLEQQSEPIEPVQPVKKKKSVTSKVIRSYKGKKMLRCKFPDCQQKFFRLANLKNHRRLVHEAQQR